MKENLEKKIKGIIFVLCYIVCCLFIVGCYLVRSVIVIRKKLVYILMMFLIFFCFVGILDDKLYGDGELL